MSLDESSAFYDINGDGYLYNLGWAGADDGLLAYDKDGDNNITARDEISFVDYVEGARTDLEGLRHFDSNADGVLDSKDAEFTKFKVWQDGEVDAGELRSLTDAGDDAFSGGEGWYTVVFTDDVAHDVDMKACEVERVFGGDGNDHFHTSGSDAITAYGGGGDDAIHGSAGEDILAGGAGADKLYGGAGSDRYVFDRGDGRDRIFDDFRPTRTYSARESYTYTKRVRYESGGQGGGYYYRDETRTGYRTVSRRRVVQEDAGLDVLEFGGGITMADLVVQRSGNDLLVGVKAKDAAAVTELSGLPDVVRIKDYANSNNKVEELAFFGGVRVSLSDVVRIEN
ncbi:calcium-binding protein [Candidatus Spongiihabitans sp.]|uniref:calcium-binding protein n=1 Tax=Candidatus Spongiihabitans sp. TaxID=3101308 RepID=UPI003C6FDD97